MMQVERHVIAGTPEIVRLCTQSKELFNRCNFLMRQAWLNHEKLPDINILVNATRELNCFKNLHNTKTAKQTVRKCLTDWANFRKALNAFFKDPSKFVSKPKPPYYKNKLAQVIFYNETILKKPFRLGHITPTNKCFSIPSTRNFKQVVITPKTFGFIVEVQYEQEKEKPTCKLDKTKACSIDVGVNNLMAITSDQQRPLLVNGRIVKSFNQWFNKNPSKSRSKKRYWRLENYFHHVSKFVINHCLEHGIGKIIIGKNEGWKQKTKKRIRRKQRQEFQSIPFFKLFQKIKYKAEIAGIEVVFTEEAYTSKASFLDNDPLPVYDPEAASPEFSGQRKHRGLYLSKDEFALNADVNGSLNIRRKVIPEFQFTGIGDRSLAARPVVVNPLKTRCGTKVPIDSGRLTTQMLKSKNFRRF